MIMLDANVLLEMIIPKRAHKNEAFRWMAANKEPYCVTMLSVHLVLHFGLKEGVPLSELNDFLSNLPKIGLFPEDYDGAMKLLVGRDHEDALQLAAAERSGCRAIATFDKTFAKRYESRIQFIVLAEF
jgi:predicted nucleic acid-binding protein